MKTIHAKVNPRLLSKASRLFTGTLAGRIIEILQNARRAGAKHLHITNKDGTIIVRDDGQGIEFFEKLLDLGGSGWDETLEASEDPAGVGLFCLAPRELTIRSNSRRLTIAADGWTGAPVEILEDPEGLLASGLNISAGVGTELSFKDEPWNAAIVKPLAVFTGMDIRRNRRSPTEEEVAALLFATRNGPLYRGLSSEDREMLYRVAIGEGLRASELYSLRPESFDLTANAATVSVEAAYSKHRRHDVLPLHPDLAERLRPWLGNKPAGQRLWPGSWIWNPALMLRGDLKRAGISYKRRGQFLDFHAQRHGAITRSSKSMDLRELQSFARHSNIKLTLQYTHREMNELASAVANVPALPSGTGRLVEAPDALHAQIVVTSPPQPYQKPHQLVVRSGVLESSVVASQGARTDACRNKKAATNGGLLSTSVPAVTGIPKRARRGSNPQPPDRQSGTLTN